MAGADIEFRFESLEDEELFVREYLPDAWNRFEASEFWERGWFWAYRQFAEYDSGPDCGLARIVFEGDPDAVVESEESYWNRFDGLESWRLRRYEETEEGYSSLLEQQKDVKGEVGGEWEYRLKPLAAQFAVSYFREFDDPLPIIGEASDDNLAGVGFWAMYHYAMIQCGFDWYDETEACLKGMQNRLESLASYEGADAAREEYDRLLAEWETYREELETWFDEHPTGEASEP
ncbi:hypothetical protein SAMN05421858_1319 [Haladaptatus litoreus]|uniref:Uncharacterized protein n=1 Tax=Haladaptatus litoreus TaxID=553468 RepID=A0A1N6XXX2_9EURY|nr:hypothetical protein [Haladaptatus litoreus]SIR07198.1 hypothetical protein SAMN05421858_1319 [Haladaptatus litoreus]